MLAIIYIYKPEAYRAIRNLPNYAENVCEKMASLHLKVALIFLNDKRIPLSITKSTLDTFKNGRIRVVLSLSAPNVILQDYKSSNNGF